MAEDAADEELHWCDPRRRGVFPLNGLIISKSLAKTLRSRKFEIRIDHDFAGVIAACAQSAPGRESTWINARIVDLYAQLFAMGFVHTVETWRDGELVGGLYGVSLGAAFFGESMFHRATDASKLALAHLVARLNFGRFRLLDAQFTTPHLISLGAIEISRGEYRRRLAIALQSHGDFAALPESAAPETILQLARGEDAFIAGRESS